MHKPYVYLYVSCALLFIMGFLLSAMDLVAKSQGAPTGTALITLVDLKAPAIQAGLFLFVASVYHFFLGIKVDAACQLEQEDKEAAKADFLDENIT